MFTAEPRFGATLAAKARGQTGEDFVGTGLARELGRYDVEAQRPISYSGQGFSLLGEKGRFVLPPDFRKAVRESGDGERVLCVAKHPRWKCLTGFGPGRVAQFEAELDREEQIALSRSLDFDREMRAAQLYGFTQVPFDDSGRFILPERFFKMGGIADAIYFQGGGLQFTIWSPDVLAGMPTGWEDAQEACLDLAAKAAGGKARK